MNSSSSNNGGCGPTGNVAAVSSKRELAEMVRAAKEEVKHLKLLVAERVGAS